MSETTSSETRLAPDFRSHYRSDFLHQPAEPEWASALRTQAWDHYQNLPEPLPVQRTLRRIPLLDDASLNAAIGQPVDSAFYSTRRESWGTLAAWGELSNAQEMTVVLPAELADKGLIFCSLVEALAKHSDKILPHLDRILPAEKNREAALNLAYWQNGFFVYVPRNLQIAEPLYLLQSLNQGKQALFTRSLIVLEQGAMAAVVCDFAAESQSAASLSHDVLEIALADASELKLVHLQNWGQEVHAHSYTQTQLGRDARLTQFNLSLGGSYHYAQSQTLLQDKGSESLFLGLNIGGGQQHFRQQTLQDHRSPHTKSDLVYHSVLKDEAYAFFNGLIYVDPLAQKSESGQVSKSLLLSDKARADAIPNLEILADDVQSGHGAAIGSLDPEQRFYLMSRGFDRQTADTLLVEGFMEEVLLRFPHADLQRQVAAHLSLHLLSESDERSEA
jgi:Fe-S cluster assembly protein SufD